LNGALRSRNFETAREDGHQCVGDGFVVSDRRWKKSLKLVQSSAWLAGEKQTSPEDLVPLVDSLSTRAG
jgi:MoxR-like ATPase